MKKQINAFIATEFTGLHKNTTLISLGIVTDSGKYFYAEFVDYAKEQLNSWLIDNIVNNLLFELPKSGEDDYYFSWNKDNNVVIQGDKLIIGKYLTDWFQSILGGPISWMDYEESGTIPITEPILNPIVDCGAYDWVLFTDLFGTAFDLPKCINSYPEDFYTHLINVGYSPEDAWNINREKIAEMSSADRIEDIESLTKGRKHNSLWDAYVLMRGYNVLNSGKKGTKI